jgi:hypothetical protein
MGKATPLINNFSAGEISPLIKDRVDLSIYQNSCLTLENCFILPQGGVVGRPGTYFVNETKDSTKKFRLVPFHFSNSQAYALEFGNQYIRFYTNPAGVGGRIVAGSPSAWVTATVYFEGDFVTNGGFTYICLIAHTSGAVFATDLGAGKWLLSSIYELSSPYLEADLFEPQFESSADTIFIAHNDYATRQLQRYSHTKWILKAVDFSPAPNYDAGIRPALTLTPAATTGTGVNFTASGAGCFLAKDTSRIIEGDKGGKACITAYTSVNVVVCTILEAFPNVNAIPSGEWCLKGHADNFLHDNGNNRTLPIGTVFTAHIEDPDDTDTNGWHSQDVGRYVFFWDGCAKVLSINSASSAQLQVLYQPTKSLRKWSSDEDDRCINWSMADTEFNSTRGYPACVSFYENRLVLANSLAKPTTAWLSVSNDYVNFSPGSVANNALFYTLASRLVNGVMWLSAANQLIIGTLGSEWKMGSGITEDPITTNNVNAKPQTYHGGKLQQPVLGFDAIIFIQRGGLKVRKLSYANDKNGWSAIDVTNLADHITTGGISNLILMQEPNLVVFANRTDGQLLGMNLTGIVSNGSFMEIAGWHRHITDGVIETTCILKTENTEDQLWLGVKRTLTAGAKRYIEYMKLFNYGDDFRDAFNVDCGLTYDGGAEKTITGITKASEAVVTSTSHGLSNAEHVRFIISAGMTELNGHVYAVSDKTDHTFKIKTLAGVYVDSTLYTTFTAGTCEKVVHSVSGLTHLEGDTVKAVVDGIYHGDYTVASGAVTLSGSGDSGYGNTIHVGLGYELKMVLPIIEAGAALGTARGKPKRINKLVLQFYKTLGPIKIGPDDDHLKTINLGDNDELFTGSVEINYSEKYGIESSSITILQEEPRPFCLLSVETFLTVYES